MKKCIVIDVPENFNIISIKMCVNIDGVGPYYRNIEDMVIRDIPDDDEIEEASFFVHSKCEMGFIEGAKWFRSQLI